MVVKEVFYKETDFKEEPLIGEIPKDWQVARLEDFAHVRGRIGWRGLKASEYTEKGPCLIANKHLLNQKVDWENCDHLSDFRYNESSEIQLERNDVIMSKDGTLGEVAFIDNMPDRATINSTMMLVRVKNESLNPHFLCYFLQGPFFRRFIRQKVSGTSIPHIFQRDMKNLGIYLPSLAEQRGIVGVLGVVDLAIEQTDEVIAKTERLKKGLMQELLTKGIGHKEYKQTPIGAVPKTWQIADASDVTAFIKDGTHTPPKRVEKGIPLFSAQNIVKGKVVRTDEDTYITEDDYWKIHGKYEIQRNDVLLTIVGTIGNSAVADVGYRFTLQRSVAIFRPDTDRLKPRFLRYVFESKPFKRQLRGHSKLTTQGGIYLKELSKLQIPIPPLEEQQKIMEILSIVDEKLELEKKEKARLGKIKLGLMDLLLTGKVRVKVD
jgi:type I restriction enzyme S subunit